MMATTLKRQAAPGQAFLCMRFRKAPHLAFHPGWLLAGIAVLGLITIAKFPVVFSIPCPWKALLHFPCVTCGSSRSLLALLHGDVLLALRWNPLFFLSIVAALPIILDGLVQLTTGYRIEIRGVVTGQNALRIILVMALLFNEIYLITQGI
ncbi:MAG: DUF2752 domain-containing protein [Calditrichaeota bacterium]|nr:MAG: DUF2752 domain-containing protein [Calditrichota bacterium]